MACTVYRLAILLLALVHSFQYANVNSERKFINTSILAVGHMRQVTGQFCTFLHAIKCVWHNLLRPDVCKAVRWNLPYVQRSLFGTGVKKVLDK